MRLLGPIAGAKTWNHNCKEGDYVSKASTTKEKKNLANHDVQDDKSLWVVEQAPQPVTPRALGAAQKRCNGWGPIFAFIREKCGTLNSTLTTFAPCVVVLYWRFNFPTELERLG